MREFGAPHVPLGTKWSTHHNAVLHFRLLAHYVHLSLSDRAQYGIIHPDYWQGYPCVRLYRDHLLYLLRISLLVLHRPSWFDVGTLPPVKADIISSVAYVEALIQVELHRGL